MSQKQIQNINLGFLLADVQAGGCSAMRCGMKPLMSKYENDARMLVEGCEDGYVVAHYKEPRQMMCLLEKFQ